MRFRVRFRFRLSSHTVSEHLSLTQSLSTITSFCPSCVSVSPSLSLSPSLSQSLSFSPSHVFFFLVSLLISSFSMICLSSSCSIFFFTKTSRPFFEHVSFTHFGSHVCSLLLLVPFRCLSLSHDVFQFQFFSSFYSWLLFVVYRFLSSSFRAGSEKKDWYGKTGTHVTHGVGWLVASFALRMLAVRLSNNAIRRGRKWPDATS